MAVPRPRPLKCGVGYQITQQAARMCMPVSAGPASAWLDTADHWQPFAGSLVGGLAGGLLGVIGAMIVAKTIVRREQSFAAPSGCRRCGIGVFGVLPAYLFTLD
jgi:hypothetical protein